MNDVRAAAAPADIRHPTHVLIDAHVHLRAGDEPWAFLEQARENLEGAARSLALESWVGCLLLAEIAGERRFEQLRGMATKNRSAVGDSDWCVRRTEESCSVIASRGGGFDLVVVAGRQIVTAEGIEVLALGWDGSVEDGRPVDVVLDTALAANAIVVLPWGFGKWWFRRGKVVRRILTSPRAARLFLGDNAGRLNLAPTPRLFRRAEASGVRILPGSDPLPFPGQPSRVGRYGFVLAGGFDPRFPARRLAVALRETAGQPPRFGRLETLGGFCRQQVALQWRKRREPRQP